LTNRKKECEKQLKNAEILIVSLADESVRWANDVKDFKSQAKLVPGNCVISAGMISYSGSFTSHFRNTMQNAWIKELDRQEISHSENVTMAKFLGNQLKIQQWNIYGLPADNTSIENGIMIDKSRRWPLCIDPQD
jgi:dynein heavy chain